MPLSKTYKPEEIEGPHYQRWEEEGAFAAGRTNTGKPYTIVIPPPNVTGSLHMGHALNNTLQDVLIRFERMRGRDALWQPGMDHAGIATQMVVERQLAEEGTDRHKMGRSKFIDRVWEWKEESGGTIFNQLRRLGASADWERERFTMDEGLNRAVTKVFVDLHKQGLIYKDQRLVNWDPKLLTAISDLEVENRESQGHLWHIKYPIENEEGRYIVVATTRPETMLGDTAVAVHPDDARYKDLIGKHVVLPLVGRRIPIIADDYADPEQGSGAVKITPGHDFNDFEVGRRHKLELINIFDAHAHLNDNVPEGYRGLERMAARKEVLAHLEAQGLLEKIDDITNTVPYGDRSGVIIEPWLTDQWYADAATLAKPAIEAVERGNITFVPRQWENTYFSWMRNIQPWCISRQLWWGHQIPAWYGPDGQVFVELDEEAALNAAKLHYGRETPLERDPDVLDTWFSSALWPFSTLGWPDKTPLLERHYPTDVLVTGFDIIFFWVARMIMMGLHFMGEVPFHTVYVHALVRDEKGAKMSKSKGNVIDPLALIDEYGADALRFTLSAMAAQGRDIKLAKTRVEGYRNFATKLWNAARFAEMNVCLLKPDFEPGAVRLTVNKWIVGETARAVGAITEAIQAYKFNEAADAAYHFTWHTYCDWYVELIKPVLMGPRAAPGMESLPLEEGEVRPQAGEGVGAQDASPMPDEDPATIQAREETRACAAWALSQILHLLHPFMPFVTEELWDKLRNESPIPETKDLIVSGWPDASALPMDKAAADEMNWVIRLVSEIRSVRAEMNIPVAAKMDAKLIGAHTETQARLATHAELINRLARLNSIDFADQPPPGAVQVIIDEATVALPLAGVIDIAAERARLEKEIQKSESEIKKVDSKLANDAFVSKAPPHVIDEQHTRRADHAQTRDKLAAALERLKKVG